MEDLINQLVSAAKTRIKTQGEFDPELIPDIADEVIDEFSRDGLISDDEDIEVLKAELINRLKNLNEDSH
ncbi:MAG: hypothetical protein AAB722_00460 [Patescibacteria group bacterium]